MILDSELIHLKPLRPSSRQNNNCHRSIAVRNLLYAEIYNITNFYFFDRIEPYNEIFNSPTRISRLEIQILSQVLCIFHLCFHILVLMWLFKQRNSWNNLVSYISNLNSVHQTVLKKIKVSFKINIPSSQLHFEQKSTGSTLWRGIHIWNFWEKLNRNYSYPN